MSVLIDRAILRDGEIKFKLELHYRLAIVCSNCFDRKSCNSQCAKIERVIREFKEVKR